VQGVWVEGEGGGRKENRTTLDCGTKVLCQEYFGRPQVPARPAPFNEMVHFTKHTIATMAEIVIKGLWSPNNGASKRSGAKTIFREPRGNRAWQPGPPGRKLRYG
jgi:hypothetical protein